MAADTANGGLSQIETHYKTFIVSGRCFTLVDPSRLTSLADGTRYCGDCRGWIELDQTSYSFLGNRDMARRTFPRENQLEVRTCSRCFRCLSVTL
jgi:hypothetical protein